MNSVLPANRKDLEDRKKPGSGRQDCDSRDRQRMAETRIPLVARIDRRLRDGLLYTGVVLVISLPILPNAWAQQFSISPTTLNFQAVQGGPTPPSQIVTVSKNSNNTVIWTSNEDALWVGVLPATGMMQQSTQVSVSVNPAGLATGSYTATVTIATANNKSIQLPVTLTVTSATSSGTAQLSWDPSISTDVAGYKVYVGTASGSYSSSISVGMVTSYTVTNLGVGNTYYFAVTDYGSSGLESGFSNEVSKSIH